MLKESSIRVLIVDDELIISATVAALLNEHGCETRTSHNGISALATIREWMPDVLVSDLNMPGMSGFELLSIVRRRFPQIYVIAMSGSYAGNEVPAEVAADAFYPKGSGGRESLPALLDRYVPPLDPPRRREAPIWVAIEKPALNFQEVVSVCCPSCLRTVQLPVDTRPNRASCPICSASVEFEVVPHLWSNGAERILMSMMSV